MPLTRVTLTLAPHIVEGIRTESRGNLSRYVNQVLEEHLEELRRQHLRDVLKVGYLEEADLDLEITHEYRFVDATGNEALQGCKAETQRTLKEVGKPSSFLKTALSASIEGPEDWAANLDTYLYGER